MRVANMKELVLQRARHLTRSPLFTQTDTRILEVSRKSPEQIDIRELEILIERRPDLRDQIIEEANSSYYGLHYAVASLHQAIVIIGLYNLLSVTMITSLSEVFEGNTRMTRLGLDSFLSHSVGVGAAARAAANVALSTLVPPMEIQISGILHDVGYSVFIRNFPRDFDRCIEQALRERRPLRDIEMEVFGIAHDELGGHLARAWNLPDYVVQSAEFHHRVALARHPHDELVALIGWVDRLVLEEADTAGGNRTLPLESHSPADDPSLAVHYAALFETLERNRDEILNSARKAMNRARRKGPDEEEDAEAGD
ncbi:HDOD domain-containing protein [bacterium]|nr:HDOD domain-containing protein [bacterium]